VRHSPLASRWLTTAVSASALAVVLLPTPAPSAAESVNLYEALICTYY